MIDNAYNFRFDNREGSLIRLKSETGSACFEIMVLEQDLVRVRMYEGAPKADRTFMIAPGMDDIPYAGRSNMDLTPFACPEFELAVEEGRIVLRTEEIELHVQLAGIQLTWINRKNGEVFLQDRKTQSYSFNRALGEGVFHYIERSYDEAYFGLGEKAGDTNRYGKSYRMMNLDPMGYDAETTDPLYKHIPFYIVKKFGQGSTYGILYDNLSDSTFDMGKEMDNYHGQYRYYQAKGGDLDYYVMLGEGIMDVTKTVSHLTGKTILPPKWTLGYSGSTMHYTDSPEAEKLLLSFVSQCREHDIPCSSFQLSSGYTSIGNKRYVFNWNNEKFPDPKRVSDAFRENGMELCANIKPALLKDHPMYGELKEKGLFVKNRSGESEELVQFWDDTGAYVDFTNKETFDWWKREVREKILEYGILSTWNDNNEFEIWDEEAVVDWFGEKRSVRDIKPVLTLLMMKASYEAQKEFLPDQRPYLISRSGTLGMQKYVQTWSGDNRTSYKTIRYNTKMGIGLSLSGVYNIGHDVGGFSGNKPTEEMFVRWIQNGIFHPRFTIHSWNDDGTVNEPWMYPEVLPIVRKLIKQRYALIPHLYDLLYKAHAHYEPIIRSTFMNYESDEKTFEENDDFMVGDSLLVATVMDEGVRERSVYLPKEDRGWYDMNTGLHYAGGQTVTVPAPLDEVPVMVRGGAVIPMNTGDITFDTKDKDARTFLVYPVKGTGTTECWIYEDDGISMDYEKDLFKKIRFTVETTPEEIRVDIKAEGDYKLPYDTFSVEFPKQELREIAINGQRQEKSLSKRYQTSL
ncbi:glycoside hydrolase family 31 protein [Anaerotalea alkaliphila]|uniref:Glycoside hydrolase family 31 protein n=1 Tax=Anaerotalea alkaliphila TaxID=2662126 RepID=A0A7X5HVT7_9FIRM|nr:glycoside hydrolase family 31 protein [Anaerotalea alkaliphila]NDL67513.1 glycoside hydrolase family 31 protein [Anaerotalea alkaliphila]